MYLSQRRMYVLSGFLTAGLAVLFFIEQLLVLLAVVCLLLVGVVLLVVLPTSTSTNKLVVSDTSAHFVSAKERFEHELERTYFAIRSDDVQTAKEAYSLARKAFVLACNHESDLWKEDASKRLYKAYDVLSE